MGTATSLTKSRILAIEAGTFVDAQVIGDNLILYRFDGTPVDVGPVRGPAGSSPGGFFLEQVFNMPSASWEIVHQQGSKGLVVETYDSLGNQIFGDVTKPDNDTIRVDFYHAMTGKALVFD